jgi:hypothetical protein
MVNKSFFKKRIIICILTLSFILSSAVFCNVAPSNEFVKLYSPFTPEGYLAYLLINEVPFPGEHRYVSVIDSKTGMIQILWVLHCRLQLIPNGYNQKQIANTSTDNIIDIITAGGQCEGFFANEEGLPVYDLRVFNRIKHLLKVANSGSKPGKFAELLNCAKALSALYIKQYQIKEYDIFADIDVISMIKVTGRAYSWMTNKEYYRPGGNFVAIPDSKNGAIAGNRFYTLKRKE